MARGGKREDLEHGWMGRIRSGRGSGSMANMSPTKHLPFIGCTPKGSYDNTRDSMKGSEKVRFWGGFWGNPFSKGCFEGGLLWF